MKTFFCEEVGVDTKGVTVSNIVIGVFVKNYISIVNCSQITTDGAADEMVRLPSLKNRHHTAIAATATFTEKTLQSRH